MPHIVWRRKHFDDIQCLWCASVIIFMRSVYTIVYFDTLISTGFLKVAVSCWLFETELLRIEYHLLKEKRQL